ncbi:MAG: AI-2E family transporter, partial [Nitrospinales bacterium]
LLTSATAFVWDSLSGLVNVIFMAVNVVIIPVATFYLLRDFDLIKENLFRLIPPRFKDKTLEVLEEINDTLAKFIRGQLMAVLYSVGLFIVGTPMSLFLGIVAGFANLVPYLGLVFGFVPAALLTYLHYQEPLPVLAVAAVFGIVQALEGMAITPRLVGDQVGLHPVAIMAAVLVGAEFFGVLGILLAVPAAAVANVLLKRGLARYQRASFYS